MSDCSCELQLLSGFMPNSQAVGNQLEVTEARNQNVLQRNVQNMTIKGDEKLQNRSLKSLLAIS